MARGLFALGETQEDAERRVRDAVPQMRILRSRRISLAGLPPLPTSGPLENPWVVVVEHTDPAEEAKLPQDEDPEGEVERSTRELYLNLATDPQALVTGVHEGFDCPACSARIEVHLPPPRQIRFEDHTRCPECDALLVRPKGRLTWEAPQLRRKPVPVCAFCGDKADSMEHAIPAWISKRLGIKEELSAEDAFIAGGARRRKQPISFGSHRAPVMCKPCNTHFKDLEDRVIPLLVPMAKGNTLALGSESQALLALWANKTAIALLAAEDASAVPVAHGCTVRNEGRVADETWVAFFPWRGGPLLSTSTGSVAIRGAGDRDCYAVLLGFRAVALYVIGFDEALPSGVALAGDPSPLRQFWPPQHEMIEWPPAPAADNTILPGLFGFVPLR
jgi:hypothetical protein